MRAALPARAASVAAGILAAALSAACGAPGGSGAGAQAPAGSQGSAQPSEDSGADPRAAFETGGLLSGMSADIEIVRILARPRGSPRAGVALGYGSPMTGAVAACGPSGGGAKEQSPAGDELFAAIGSARAPLPGPALAIAASGESVIVSCALPGGRGMLEGLRPDDSGGGFSVSWKREDRPRDRLLPTPGGRFAAGGEDGIIAIHDAADGRELWRADAGQPVADLAYAPGILIAAAGERLFAYDEGGGKRLWEAALGAEAVSASAGAGVVAALTRAGALEAFVLADGAALCRAPGPFDPTIRAIVDSGRVIAALPRGGAREIELKAGTILRSWDWEGPASFLVADSESLYAGAAGASGPRIIVAPRSGNGLPSELPLPSPAFDAPAAAHGSRGGLLMLLQDGSVALATSEAAKATAASALDAAAAPSEPVSSAIAAAIGRFRARSPAEPASKYLRFDVFVSGVPVDPSVDFTAYRYDAASSGKVGFKASPALQGAVVAAYDDQGAELEANVDELGARAGIGLRAQKGKTYWIVAGRAASADESPFRLFAE